jgi:hypothetical protein
MALSRREGSEWPRNRRPGESIFDLQRWAIQARRLQRKELGTVGTDKVLMLAVSVGARRPPRA